MAEGEDDTGRRRRRKGAGTGEAGRRELARKVKTARGRKLSSTRWLQRQLNDPYVQKARELGYRSRAAFKLLELDERFSLIRRGARVVDLGAAPGGWAQVAMERGAAFVVGIDLLAVEALAGAKFIEADFTDAAGLALVRDAVGGRADVVMSDMAANTTGHRATDHMRVVALVEDAAAFAQEALAPGGVFVAKVFQGGAEGELLAALKRSFEKVRHAKPPASRSDSPETYLVATGFRGVAD